MLGAAAPATAGPLHATGTASTVAPAAKAWALVDADTGNIIDAGNDRQPLRPASLTKVITALTVTATIPADAEIPVSARAEAAPPDKMLMKQGQAWTFSQMIHSLLISSANDAAVALAEGAGGSVEGFQSMLAATATALGMADNPVLRDPAGLDGPDGVDGGNLVSARDLAIATRALLATPTLAPIVATPVYYFDGPDNVRHRLTNHNKSFLTSYPGAIGVKTGSTSRAGACLIAAARRDGRTMLAVVLSATSPNQTATHLLDEGFSTAMRDEPAADRLPPVPAAANRPTAPQQAVSGAAPANGGASVPPAASRPTRSSPGSLSPVTRLLILAVVVPAALIGLLRLRVLARRRRRGRRPPRPGAGRPPGDLTRAPAHFRGGAGARRAPHAPRKPETPRNRPAAPRPRRSPMPK